MSHWTGEAQSTAYVVCTVRSPLEGAVLEHAADTFVSFLACQVVWVNTEVWVDFGRSASVWSGLRGSGKGVVLTPMSTQNIEFTPIPYWFAI